MEAIPTSSPRLKVRHFQELHQYLPGLSVSKTELLLLLSCCLILSKTTSVWKCAEEVNGVLDSDLKASSAYQKLSRFFNSGLGDKVLWAIFHFIVLLFYCSSKDSVLLMDRTNWKLGKRKMVNLLVIGVLYKGLLIPLVWQDLHRAGNSNTTQRLDLVDKFREWWQRIGLALPTLYIVGDREFIGRDWLIGLQQRSMYYVMRLKESRKFQLWYRQGIRDKKARLKVIHRWMQRYKQAYAEVVIGGEVIANLVICPLKKNGTTTKKYLYLITNIDDAKTVSDLYTLRWQIEVCFKHLKTNGFNLEDTKLEAAHKIELMMGVLILMYALCIREGLLVHEKEGKKVLVKTYKNGKKTLAKSVFRKGLTQLKRHYRDWDRLIRYLQTLCEHLLNNYLKIKQLNIAIT